VSLIAGVLLASVLGSVHCAAMCGPFTCLYATGPSASLRSHASYNVGRLLSYVALGAFAGLLGARVDDVGRLAGVAHAATIVAGTLMILWAAASAASHFGVRVPVTLAPEWARSVLGGALQRARDWSPSARGFLIGSLTTLLPCGWLYTFVVVAGSTASAPAGAAVMVAFWLGTVPMMMTVASVGARVLGPIARRLPLLGAGIVFALGLLAVAGRLAPPAMSMHTHAHLSYVGR
jgi:sulfite exporter TauE/SafE